MGSGFDARLKKLEEQFQKEEESRLRSESGVMLGVSGIGRPQLEGRCDWILRFARKHAGKDDHQLFAACYFWGYIKPDSEFESFLKAKNRFVVEASREFSQLKVEAHDIEKISSGKNIG